MLSVYTEASTCDVGYAGSLPSPNCTGIHVVLLFTMSFVAIWPVIIIT